MLGDPHNFNPNGGIFQDIVNTQRTLNQRQNQIRTESIAIVERLNPPKPAELKILPRHGPITTKPVTPQRKSKPAVHRAKRHVWRDRFYLANTVILSGSLIAFLLFAMS